MDVSASTTNPGEGHPGESPVTWKTVSEYATRIGGILRAAMDLMPTGGEDPAQDSQAKESNLRMLVTRALLTNEWEESVDARLSEASAVLDLPASYSHALHGAGVESLFADAWATWNVDTVASLAPQLLNPHVESTDAAPLGLPFVPTDVVESMTDWLLGFEFEKAPRILGLRTGTGALVASLARKVIAEKRHSPEDLLTGLKMTDEDRGMLDVACVIVARVFEQSLSIPPGDVLQRTRTAAYCGDPVAWVASANDQFDLVVGTVPFGEKGVSTEVGDPTEERSGLILQTLATVIRDDGAGTVVAPSSIVTSVSGPMAMVRDSLLDRFQTAEFLNYDLTTEPLLGPADWASRTIVRLYASGTGSVVTTPMMRWTPDRRSAALSDPPRATLYQPPPLGQHSFVPRIGSVAERRLVDAIIAHSTARWDLVEVERTHGDHRSEGDVFSVGPTVRGRFSIALTSPRIYFGEAPSGGARYGVKPLEPDLADPALAVMLSRTALWWWFATSDGRHVRPEHITQPLSWLRLLSPEELALGTEIANALRATALASAGGSAGSTPTGDAAGRLARLAVDFETALLSNLGMSESDVRELLSKTSFVNV